LRTTSNRAIGFYLVVCERRGKPWAEELWAGLEMSLSKSNSRLMRPPLAAQWCGVSRSGGGIDLDLNSVRPPTAADSPSEFVNRTSSRGTSGLASLPRSFTLEHLNKATAGLALRPIARERRWQFRR